jgi:hypothetical protein
MKPSCTNVHTCVPKHFGAQACLPTRQAQKGYEKTCLHAERHYSKQACLPTGRHEGSTVSEIKCLK